MKEASPAMEAMGRAGRRVVFHLLQAAIETLKAVEAVIDEIGGIGDRNDQNEGVSDRQRIEVE
ncbi:MAG: hypothetical protein WBM90_11825 [Acidimicrobiia bacterium]